VLSQAGESLRKIKSGLDQFPVFYKNHHFNEVIILTRSVLMNKYENVIAPLNAINRVLVWQSILNLINLLTRPNYEYTIAS